MGMSHKTNVWNVIQKFQNHICSYFSFFFQFPFINLCGDGSNRTCWAILLSKSCMSGTAPYCDGAIPDPWFSSPRNFCRSSSLKGDERSKMKIHANQTELWLHTYSNWSFIEACNPGEHIYQPSFSSACIAVWSLAGFWPDLARL